MFSLVNKIIAHRGESYDAPENTMSAIMLAWERGDRVVEIDIHLSKDNEIVVIHDEDTSRVSDHNINISETNYSLLNKIDVGAWKNIKYKNQYISLLDKFIQTVPADGKLVIEIKSDSKILKYLKKTLDNANLAAHKIEIIAFDFKTLAEAKKIMPQYKMLWLMDLDYYWYNRFYPYSIRRISKRLNKYNIDGVNLFAGKIANEEFIQKLKKNEFLVYVWTVNNPKDAFKYLNWGVDCVTSDKCAYIINELESVIEEQKVIDS